MAWEFEFLDSLQHLHTAWLDRVMIFLTRLGDAGLIWLVAVGILLVFPKTRKIGWLLVVAILINTVLCNLALKPLIGRIRPFDVNSTVSLLINKPHDFSFPSGHTAIGFTVVGALFFGKVGSTWKPALLLASLIAFSRMYLYVHYPTDILGGIIVGIFSGWLACKIVEKKCQQGKLISE